MACCSAACHWLGNCASFNLPHARQGIGAGATVANSLMLLPLGLMLPPVDPVDAADRDADLISGDQLAETLGPLDHVALLDPQDSGASIAELQTDIGALLSRPETNLSSCALPPIKSSPDNKSTK
jgi:hypothetical protein